MDENIRRIKKWTGIGINPAEEDTLQEVRNNDILGSPNNTTKYVASAVQGSHIAGAGIKHIYLQNTGGVLIRTGGTDTAATIGIVWTPYTGFMFRNIKSGWKIYFIRDTTAAIDGEISFTEFMAGA